MALPLPDPPWPPSLASLKALDDLLRCGICYDYYNIAMIIPQCSHNFCSLCIRQSLSSKTHCPACFVAASESDLRNNRLLDDLVRSFGSARQQLLQLVQDARQTPSPLGSSRRPAGSRPVRSAGSWPVVKEEVPPIESFFRKAEVCASTTADGLAGTVQKILNTEQHHSLDSTAAEADGRDDELGSRESPECAEGHEKPSTSLVKAVRKVECPVCGVAIPEQYINKHLDSCLASEEKKDSLRSSAHKRKPLAKVVYNLLSDRDLKRKLKEHGLSTRGSRQQLVRRHQEFVHMYNAQCDALTPKSVAEIVKELEKNEKVRLQLEFNKTGENSLTFTKDQTEEEIDEIHTDYRFKQRACVPGSLVAVRGAHAGLLARAEPRGAERRSEPCGAERRSEPCGAERRSEACGAERCSGQRVLTVPQGVLKPAIWSCFLCFLASLQAYKLFHNAARFSLVDFSWFL